MDGAGRPSLGSSYRRSGTTGKPMITEVVKSDEGRIRLKVKGLRGREQEVEAAIDTGYTASLTLPPAAITALGLWRSNVQTVSAHLIAEYGRGFSRFALSRMVKFAESFHDCEIVAALSQQLGWSHFIEIIPLDDPLE